MEQCGDSTKSTESKDLPLSRIAKFMLKPVTDLFGFGEVARWIVELIKHISTNKDRRVQRESQQLKNVEQALKNLEIGCQCLSKIVAVGKKHKIRPEDLNNLITMIAGSAHAQIQQFLPPKRRRLVGFLHWRLRPADLSMILETTTPEKTLTVPHPRRNIRRIKRGSNSVPQVTPRR
jgi:hypothetical protein